MGAPSAASVVVLRFPFSDLASSKVRPAVVLGDAAKGDWILCQITGNAYCDSRAIELTDASFATGSLRFVSYARPGKLFTANQSLMAGPVGTLKDDALKQIVDAVIQLLREGLKS